MSPQKTSPAADGSIRLDRLREAIQNNRVSFPAPIPVFECQHRADIQWRLVALYFVRGWSCTQLGNRYQVTPARIQQLLHGWVKRAFALGYLQHIPAGDASAAERDLARKDVRVDDNYPLLPPEILASQHPEAGGTPGKALG